MAVKDPEYLKFCRRQECHLRGHGRCFGIVQAHHSTGGKGLGQKNDDARSYPLCAAHHTDRHAFTGFFADFTKERLRQFERDAVDKWRGIYMGLGSNDGIRR